MAHATPITGQASIALALIALGLIVAIIAARTGHGFLADNLSLLLAAALTIVLYQAGAFEPAALAALLGLGAFYRVCRALRAGALR